MENIKICFVKVPNPIDKAIQAVIGLFCNTAEYTEDPWDADLIIADKLMDLVTFYTKDGCYMVIDHQNYSKKKQPENVHMISCTGPDFLKFLMETMTKEFAERKPAPEKIEIKFRIENPGATKILVIDDTPQHQKSAEILLAEYDLTIARGYDEAMDYLKNNPYDVVLTDMEMPASKHVMDQILGELIPYGLLLYSEAARCGAKHVAVVTNLNHHTDPIANAFDTFCHNSIRVENAVVKFMHAPMTSINGEYAKDWKEALERLQNNKGG
jgi:CheY-like chemotaxis protein